MYEKLKLYHEIVQYHMEHHQISGLLQACQRHGEKVPNLWVQALSYFAAQAEPYEQEIQMVLRALKERKLLPPLMILQILSQNPTKQLSVVKDFIIQSLQEENDLIKADQEEIQRYQMETQTMREEIQKLHTQSDTRMAHSQTEEKGVACAAGGAILLTPFLLAVLVSSVPGR